MRDIFIVCFILSIPLLAVLGHDIYMAYTNTELEGVERFYPSDLGWLWIQYGPNSYDWMVENTDAVLWNGFIDPVLQQSAAVIAAAPMTIYICCMLIFKIFGLGSFQGQGLFRVRLSGGAKTGGKGDFAFGNKNAPAKKAKYKRK